MTKPLALIFAIHATDRGFGYVAFEGPFTPYDWGIVFARGDKNAVCLRKIEIMFDRFAPETLLLESFGKGSSLRSERIARLYRSIINLAGTRSVNVVVYNRADIKAAFRPVGAGTRQEIAAAVARHVEAFRHRLPRPRKPWESEDRRMALFSAGALVLTHYRLGAAGLFDDLSRPP
jgi:hypothetical protein